MFNALSFDELLINYIINVVVGVFDSVVKSSSLHPSGCFEYL
jgi:hypothetical protein